jgi:hypothetical protein
MAENFPGPKNPFEWIAHHRGSVFATGVLGRYVPGPSLLYGLP